MSRGNLAFVERNQLRRFGHEDGRGKTAIKVLPLDTEREKTSGKTQETMERWYQRSNRKKRRKHEGRR